MKITEYARQILALTLIKDFGPRAFQGYEERCQNVPEIFQAVIQEKNLDAKTLLSKADEELEKAHQTGVQILTRDDPRYPEILKTIYDPPIVLYVKGTLPDPERLFIGVVGSRLTSLYGQRMARKISADLGLAGTVIVSGMALGIDTAAHEGALSAKALTVAVLGGGLSCVYPKENMKLFNRIVETGAVISEYPVEMKPRPAYFPVRNRIISGLSRGLVVVEARRASGALITADMALEQGREVYAMPGQADSRTADGSNALIQQGARLITSADEILQDFGVGTKKNKERQDLSADEKKVYAFIRSEPTPIDTVVEESGFQTAKTLSILSQLEIKGVVRQLPGKCFVKK